MNLVIKNINYNENDISFVKNIVLKKQLAAGVLSSLLMALGILLIRDNYNLISFVVIFLPVAIFLSSFFYIRTTHLIKDSFKEMNQSPASYIFRDEDIFLTKTSVESNIKWNHFQKALLTKNHILLFQTKYIYFLIPLRYFSEEENLLFIGFIKTNIKQVIEN
ncbi:MAG: YcxB family protein [Bacteriovoracaceae bacterium]|nr:YcxB family protein [Bacteriovoracaceae bacterium]